MVPSSPGRIQRSVADQAGQSPLYSPALSRPYQDQIHLHVEGSRRCSLDRPVLLDEELPDTGARISDAYHVGRRDDDRVDRAVSDRLRRVPPSAWTGICAPAVANETPPAA